MFPKYLLRKCPLLTVRISRSIVTYPNHNMINMSHKTLDMKKSLSKRMGYSVFASSKHMSNLSFRIPQTRKPTTNAIRLEMPVRYG